MKILIAENDLACRQNLYNSLSCFGECYLAEDGLEAIRAYMASLKTNCPYELVFLAREMPSVDGLRTCRAIRIMEEVAEIEPEKKAKIVLTAVIAETLSGQEVLASENSPIPMVG